MANDSESFRFDLDTKDAVANAQGLLDKIKEIGNSENLTGLVKGLSGLAAPIAIIGTALFAVKEAFDLAFDGAQLELQQKRLETLADTAGVSSQALVDGMAKAADGTMTTSQIIDLATQGIVRLGENADKIPQIFELARKTAIATGHDTTEVFNAMTQAIVTGNQRMISQYGLRINMADAEKKYAQSLGITTTALSDQGKQAARLSEILVDGNKKFDGIGTSSHNLIETSKQLKAAWGELGEVISTAFSKAFGGVFQKALEFFTSALKNVGDTLKGTYGSAVEVASSKTKTYNEALTKSKEIMKDLESHYGSKELAMQNEQYVAAARNVEFYTVQLNALNRASGERGRNADRKQAFAPPLPTTPKGQDKDKVAEEEAKFNEKLIAMAQQRLQTEMNLEDDAKEQAIRIEQEKAGAIAEFDAKIEKVRADGAKGEVMTAAQANRMIIELEAEKALKVDQIIDKSEDQIIKAYDNRMKAAKTVSEGVAAGFAYEGAVAEKTLLHTGNLGQTAFGAIKSNSIAAFKAIGDGSKSAGDAMKMFILGSLADIAEAQGEQLLAYGIGTFDPIPIAEGGALIALGSLLRSQSGGGSSGITSSSGGGGGGSIGSPASSSTGTAPTATAQQAGKSVTIQVQGHYFETEQTKTKLVDLIRQSTDATDFKYQQIGVG